MKISITPTSNVEETIKLLERYNFKVAESSNKVLHEQLLDKNIRDVLTNNNELLNDAGVKFLVEQTVHNKCKFLKWELVSINWKTLTFTFYVEQKSYTMDVENWEYLLNLIDNEELPEADMHIECSEISLSFMD